MAIKPNQLSPEPLSQSAYSSPPTTGAGKGAYATKTISGVTEAFYIDSDGNEVQLTNAGGIATPPGSGEANTGANLGSSGAGKAEVFASKSGVTLNFKRLVAGTNVTLSQDGNEITINATGGSGETNTASNLGTGEGQVFASKSGVDLRFRSLKAGSNISISQDGNEVTINATGDAEGESNTASNLGTGEGQVFASKSGVDLRLRSLKAGSNISISQDGNEITINSSGGGASELDDLTDVTISDPSDGDVLTYDSGTWVAAPSVGGSANEFSFTLAAAALMADRIAGATGVPVGWTIAPGDTAGVDNLGTNADTLVISHNLEKVAIEIKVLELNTAGPTSTQGFTTIDLTTQGVQKSSVDKNHCGIIGLQPLTASTRALTVFVKLI